MVGHALHLRLLKDDFVHGFVSRGTHGIGKCTEFLRKTRRNYFASDPAGHGTTIAIRLSRRAFHEKVIRIHHHYSNYGNHGSADIRATPTAG